MSHDSKPVSKSEKAKEDRVSMDFLITQYEALSNRQISHNALVWNAPSLLFVAQAFLWGISLDLYNGMNVVIRCIISFASILIAFASLQNFIRLRWMEIADARQLEAIELFMRNRSEKIGLDKAYMPMIVHHTLNKRTIISPDGKDGGGLEQVLADDPFFSKCSIGRWRTFNVWKFVLEVILLVAIALFAYNLYLAVSAFV